MRVPGDGKSKPYALYSGSCQPAPIASSNRPPLITSSVAPIFASSAGERNELHSTLALTRTRRVWAAHAVIVVHDSRMSLAGSGIASR